MILIISRLGEDNLMASNDLRIHKFSVIAFLIKSDQILGQSELEVLIENDYLRFRLKFYSLSEMI